MTFFRFPETHNSSGMIMSLFPKITFIILLAAQGNFGYWPY